MTNRSTVVPLRQPDEVNDPLTEVPRSGARRLLAQAVEAEAEAFLATMRDLRLPDGRERVVRHGHGPERLVQTGIGPVAVRWVKLRDRGAGAGGERIHFTSAILPRWARRTRSLDALLPILYLIQLSHRTVPHPRLDRLGTGRCRSLSERHCKVLDQLRRVLRHGSEASDDHQQPPLRPGVLQPHEAQRASAAPSARRRFGHHGYPRTEHHLRQTASSRRTRARSRIRPPTRAACPARCCWSALSTAQEIWSMCRSEIGARRRASGIVGLTAVAGLWPDVGC